MISQKGQKSRLLDPIPYLYGATNSPRNSVSPQGVLNPGLDPSEVRYRDYV